MALFPARDLGPLLLLALTAFLWKKHFYMRGLTYRTTVVPVARERLLKSIFYVGFLGTLDTVLRRSGHLMSQILPILSQLLPSESVAFLLRCCLIHLPWAVWACRGPLSDAGSTRDDRGWSDAVTRSAFWRHVARCFGCRIVLSEEWRQLTVEQRQKWYDRHYVIAMHPHGLLPLGAILNGLTWAGGGLKGITASGAELTEPATWKLRINGVGPWHQNQEVDFEEGKRMIDDDSIHDSDRSWTSFFQGERGHAVASTMVQEGAVWGDFTFFHRVIKPPKNGRTFKSMVNYHTIRFPKSYSSKSPLGFTTWCRRLLVLRHV